MLQEFVLNDNRKVNHVVVEQIHRKFDSVTIQFSKVIHYYIDMKPKYRYIYEEIDNSEDSVIYARYMGSDNISKNYSWARRILEDYNDSKIA